MAKAQAKRGAGRRSPSKGLKVPTRRNALWIGAAVLFAGVATIAVVSRDGDDEPAATPSAAGGGVTGGDFHSLVVDPTTPGRLFVGGHQAVSTSTDGGRTWSRVNSLTDADAMGWAFTGDAVYVTGHPGISRSTDGAATFRRANDGLPDTDVHAFGAAGSTLYAAGPALGVTASTDGGRTWAARTQSAGQSFFGRILIGPDDDQLLVAADARKGASASSDGGRTWRSLGRPTGAVWVSRSGDTLYVSGQSAAKSSDGGATWTDLQLPEGASLVEADPTDPQLLYTGVHDGDAVTVWVSRDGGERWTRP